MEGGTSHTAGGAATRRLLACTACALVAAITPSVAGAQTTVLVPPAGGGVGGTFGGRVADGGDRVVLQSPSAALVPGDTNGATDLFLWRRGARTLERVTVGPGGRQADAGSFDPDLSDDGRWLVFCSAATNLLRRRVAMSPLAGPAIHLRDLRTGRTRLVSRRAARDLDGDPVCHPSVSRGGRYVAFARDRRGVRHIRLYDRRTGGTRTITRGARADSDAPAVSPDGAAVVFGSLARLSRADVDRSPDVYRYGIRSRRTALVSGAPGIHTCAPEASASRGGRFVAFACDLAIHVHDHRRGTTQRLAPSGSDPRISADGRRVAFQAVDGLLPGANESWTEVYAADRVTGVIARVAAAPDGTQPDGHVLLSDLSGDGRWIAFGATSALLGFPRVSPWGDVFVSGPWP